jgi:AraC family ethanolamine operon transcriptional activator
MILEPGCDFALSSNDEHDWCSIFVPSHKFSRGADLIEPSSGSKKMISRVTRPNPQLAKEFLAVVRPLMISAMNCLNFESTPAAMCAASKLLRIASLVVEQRREGESKLMGRPRFSRQEIIRRSQELLEQRKGEPILVGELAAAAGVSERTLRQAFQEYYGVSPIHYLHLRQLHKVHLQLKAAAPENVAVSNVLLRNGVWNFGRFASRYRQLFGELPSQTLRKRKFALFIN